MESIALAAIREQFTTAQRRGLFNAASVGTVLWRLISPDSKAWVAPVLSVNTFVSHSWSSSSGLKFLAVCHHFNLDLALASSLMAWMLAILFTIIQAKSFDSIADGGLFHLAMWLICLPLGVFLMMYFGGHMFSRRSLWFDQVCVNNTQPFGRLQTLQSIPAFVSRSNELLVLWDETFWERLWCIYEARD